jgi:folate-binding Fe-S cluster repair protein YgfZ
MRMVKSVTAAMVLALGMTVVAHAETAQQQKMTTCNADAKAKALKGADRQSFMKTCLSAGGAAPAAKALTAQQQKMKTCNADAKAKALKGADRKTFMKTCLSGPAN